MVDIQEAAGNVTATARARVSGAVRRRILLAGLSGAAVSLLPWMDGPVSASNGDGSGSSNGSDGSTPDDSTQDPFSPDNSGATGVTTGGTDAPTDLTNPSVNTDEAQAPRDTQPPTGDSTGGSTNGTGDTEAPTTTTAPPKQPTAADVELLDFAQGLELTIRNLYDLAIDTHAFSGAQLEDVNAIRESHEGYGSAIAGVIGGEARNRANAQLFGQLQSGFTGVAADVATAAAELEDTAVATHIDLIGRLEGINGTNLLASMAMVEARNATLLKMMAGASALTDQLATSASPLAPTDFATG